MSNLGNVDATVEHVPHHPNSTVMTHRIQAVLFRLAHHSIGDRDGRDAAHVPK